MTKKSPKPSYRKEPMFSGENMRKEQAKIMALPQELRRAYCYPVEPTGLYSEEIIKEICDRYKIPPELRDDLFHVLERAGKDYARNTYLMDSTLRTAELRDSLEKISADAMSLLHRLDDWRSDTVQAYNEAYNELEAEAKAETLGGPVSRMGRIGAFKSRQKDDGFECEYLSTSEILDSLNFINLIANTALKNIEPDKGGRPQEGPIFQWVIRIGSFWEHKLGRKFGVDIEKSYLISETGYFLADCFTPLDPHNIKKLASQMRAYKKVVAKTRAKK